MEHKEKNSLVTQGIPLSLTIVSFLFFTLVVYIIIRILNRGASHAILTKIYITDIIVGIIIYLKTSVDFAIFIGNLMASYPGWKNRIAIEISTAAGNALGTIMILVIWNYFRTVEWLLAIMILIAALVLIKLAEDGMDHVGEEGKNLPEMFRPFAKIVKKYLAKFNHITHPFLKLIIPNLSMKPQKSKSWGGLFILSFTIPFILGLDDFAGYVPVFNIVNVFGFSVGVLLGHMILNLLLFISPERTIKAVKNPLISLFGSIAFIALAGWGFYEVFKIFFK
ncbi:MAG: hypothetical protein Q7R95_06665 [bacterium]|nr:hypothetical protein [bacterium]